MKVLRPTETDSLLCMRVKMPSTKPISASFAGTFEPIRAINTMRPTCQCKVRQMKTNTSLMAARKAAFYAAYCIFDLFEVDAFSR